MNDSRHIGSAACRRYGRIQGGAPFVLTGSLLLLLLLSCRSIAPVRETGFLNRSVRIGTTTYAYVVYVPKEYDRRRTWPVVLFLHGAGERGSDGIRQTGFSMGHAIRNGDVKVPFVAVFPQAPADKQWLGEVADAAIRALDRTVDEYRGDPKRVYLTGLSLGGYGTWHLAIANPGRFAAIVPICGGIVAQETAQSVRQSPLTKRASDPYRFVARALRDTPVWIFHGSADQVIPASESRLMEAALKEEGGNVRYTEYKGVGHNSWDRAYTDPELWTWLMAQQR